MTMIQNMIAILWVVIFLCAANGFAALFRQHVKINRGKIDTGPVKKHEHWPLFFIVVWVITSSAYTLTHAIRVMFGVQ